MSHAGSYDEVVERARAAAAAKRISGEVPEGTGAALDRLFLEVAPGGARPEGEGLEAMVEMLARYRYDPSIAIGSGPGVRGTVARLAKRTLRPLTTWALRHLTDQLNAYHLAETELLRAIVQTRAAGEAAELHRRAEPRSGREPGEDPS